MSLEILLKYKPSLFGVSWSLKPAFPVSLVVSAVSSLKQQGDCNVENQINAQASSFETLKEYVFMSISIENLWFYSRIKGKN